MKIQTEDFVRGNPVIRETFELSGDGANDDDQQLQDTVLPGYPFRVVQVQHFLQDITAVMDYEVDIGDEPVNGLVAATPVPDGGNTGDGTLTVSAVGSKAKVGDYVLTCTAEAANAGTFNLVDPDGEVIKDDITVGVAFSTDHLSGSISDGAADWDADDFITVTTRAATTPADATRANATLRHDDYLQGAGTDVLKMKTTCDSGGEGAGLRVRVTVEPAEARPAY